MAGSRKTVIGLFVDGLDVKLARVSVKRKKLIVHELKSATLATKLEERKTAEATLSFNDERNEFGVGDIDTPEPMAMEGGEDNSAALLGLLSQYKPRTYSIAYGISEPSIYYHSLESNFGLKGKKLKQRIIEELKNVRTFQPTPDAVDALTTDEGNLLCVVREDGLSLINHLENIKGFLGNRLPNIAGIDSSDVALMNMVRANYTLQPDEISVVVYVGVEFTRLIFMRGYNFFQFAPILSEGYDSPNLQNTVYSRLLLEQDNLNIQRISNVILAGESRRIELRDFLQQLLPDQNVNYLRAPNIDLSNLPAEQHDMISDYAVALGVAWKFAEPSSASFYHTNLLPETIREGQRVFKLSWHGYVALVAIFGSTLYFTTEVQKKNQQIQEQAALLDVKQAQVAENTTLMNSISMMQDQLARYNASMALYDSLVPGADKFSRAFMQLSNGVDDLSSIWVTEFVTQENGATSMAGFSVTRSRIPRLSALFDKSQLKEVSTEEIRGETVYRYKIDVPTIVK